MAFCLGRKERREGGKREERERKKGGMERRGKEGKKEKNSAQNFSLNSLRFNFWNVE